MELRITDIHLPLDEFTVAEAFASELNLACPLMPWHSQRDTVYNEIDAST